MNREKLMEILPHREPMLLLDDAENQDGLKTVIRWLDAFPVERGTGDMSAIETAKQVIRDKEILGIFPEGTRSKDNNLLRFKSGLALIAQQTGASILPMSITYLNPKKSFRSRVIINYGKLLTCEELGIVPSDEEFSMSAARSLKGATRMLQSTIADLKTQNI